MRTIINYIRSCFCKHDFELLSKVNNYHSYISMDVPMSCTWIYRCKKCGYVQKVES